MLRTCKMEITHAGVLLKQIIILFKTYKFIAIDYYYYANIAIWLFHRQRSILFASQVLTLYYKDLVKIYGNKDFTTNGNLYTK